MPKDAKEESHDPAVIVTRMYDFTLWLLPKVQHFPREWRFNVGDRLIATGLDLLTALIEAAYARNKQNALYTATNRINTLRYLLRLSKDLKILAPYRSSLRFTEARAIHIASS